MGVPTSDVGYTIATTRKVHKNMWWHWGVGNIYIYIYTYTHTHTHTHRTNFINAKAERQKENALMQNSDDGKLHVLSLYERASMGPC